MTFTISHKLQRYITQRYISKDFKLFHYHIAVSRHKVYCTQRRQEIREEEMQINMVRTKVFRYNL